MIKMKPGVMALLAITISALPAISQQSQPASIVLHMPYQNLNGTYVLENVAIGESLNGLATRKYTLTLDDAAGTVSLKLCNSFHGKYESTMGGTIRFGAMGGTKMMCADRVEEQDILQAFATANEFKYDNGRIELFHNGNLVITAKRQASSAQGNLSQIDKRPLKITAIYTDGNKLSLANYDAGFTYDSGQGMVYGRGICNRYFGKLSFVPNNDTGGSIAISGIGSTLMACNDPQQLEATLLKALEFADSYSIVEDGLVLFNQKKILMELVWI